jgi:hypothetical protein
MVVKPVFNQRTVLSGGTLINLAEKSGDSSFQRPEKYTAPVIVADPKTFFGFGFGSTKFFFRFGYGFCRHIFWDKPFQSFLLMAYEHFLNTIL